MGRALSELISDISLYSILIPILVVLYRRSRLNKVQRLLTLLVFATVSGEIAVYQSSIRLENNLLAIHIFSIVQFILIVLILRKGLIPSLTNSLFKWLIIVFVAFALVDAFYLNGIHNFNTYSRPVGNIILLFLAVFFFYKSLRELKIESLECEPLFWINIGILIYFSGSLFIFLSTNYMKASNEALLTLWGIHALFNIVLNITYSIALWVKPVR